MVELQRIAPALEAAGYALFAISYDHQNGLNEFAAKHGITFPLLSDEGSAVIRGLGILDADLVEHHAVFDVATRDEQQGVAYPMTFVLDASGRVERKIVEANYRLRQGGRLLFEQLTGAQPAGATDHVEGRAREEHLALRAWMDSPTYYAYQRLGLHLELTIAPGWHIYGPEVPAGYQPLEVEVHTTPSGGGMAAIPWPPTKPFSVDGLAEDFAVYAGLVRLVIPIELIVPRGSGDVQLELEVRSQACSATECLPPTVIRTTMTLPEAPTL